MSFANPMALAWAALAIPIIIFYILKIRLRRVPVSTTLFWEQIFEEKKPRSLWETLRHLLSLLIQLAILGLVVLALGEPFFRREILEARRVVLVVDNSASMNATDVPPRRLAKAKQEGETIINGLRFRDEMAIVAAGTQPQVVCGLTGHQRTLREALRSIPTTDGPTRVSEAVELARRLLVDQKNRQVVLLTDGAFDGAEALVKENDVQVVAIGKRTGNVGLTRFQVRRSLLDPVGYEILAEVANASDEKVETRLEIDLAGNVVDVVPLTLEPGATWSHVFEKTSTEGGKLTATIQRPDALRADNQAWAILPHREIRPVTLVTDGNLFLEKVFEANPLVRLSVVREPPSGPLPGALTVLHRKVPAKIPAGPVLVIEPTSSSDLWQIGETVENPIVTQQDRDSPLMSHVRLDNVLMPEARKLTIATKDPVKTLAASLGGEPLYLAIDRPAGKVLVLTVNLDKGDLPLQTAFPILVANALGWFSGNKGELREAVAAGALAEFDLPRSGTYVLQRPDGPTQPLPSQGIKMTLGPLDHCGVWSVRRRGEAQAEKTRETEPDFEVACNLASRRESDLRPPKDWTPKAPEVQGGFGGRPLWYGLIIGAWALVTAEWFLYQRRWIS
jgi:hypothetical protein